MTRRSRDAEHGPEQRSLPRRFHNIKYGLERRGKPIVLPIIALLIALGASFADRQEHKSVESELTAPAVSAKPIQGVTGEGAAFIMFPIKPKQWPMLEFTVTFTRERL